MRSSAFNSVNGSLAPLTEIHISPLRGDFDRFRSQPLRLLHQNKFIYKGFLLRLGKNGKKSRFFSSRSVGIRTEKGGSTEVLDQFLRLPEQWVRRMLIQEQIQGVGCVGDRHSGSARQSGLRLWT